MRRYLQNIVDAVVSALKGMRITARHVVKKPVTLQFPDERWVMPERFRGFIFNDIWRCDCCLGCAKICPVDCIYIRTTGKGVDRFMYRYAIDFNKCIWCGLCTQVCPTDACQHSHDYDHSLYERRDLVYEFVDPGQPVPCHKTRRAEMGWYVPESKTKTAAPADGESPAPPAPGDGKGD